MLNASLQPQKALPESEFELLPDKALLWNPAQSLIVSDIHIGKAAHFRKHGIALPNAVNNENLWRLANLLLDTQARRLLILGDLVHSAHNQEWEQFVDFRANFPQLEVVLIRGNHDILADYHYVRAEITCLTALHEGGFYFTHDPSSDRREQNKNSQDYQLSGHLHPAIVLRGEARQSLRLPCFWFGENQGVLPAFGSFTGTKAVRPAKNDRIYAIGEGRVFSV
jgi:DNA ligase-associated metallophosphoesterase